MTLSPGLRFRADDIWDAPHDDKRHEVIDGELYVAPAPDWGHQSSLSNFLWRIGAHVHANKLGKVVTAPVGVGLDEANGVQPVLVCVSQEREHIIVARGVEGAPDLLM